MALAQARRGRLTAAMREAGIDALLLYGNAWQGDYLRYGCDFGILEGHGVALVSADGTAELYLDSATDAERAEAETADVAVRFHANIGSAVSARLALLGKARIAAAPRPWPWSWLCGIPKTWPGARSIEEALSRGPGSQPASISSRSAISKREPSEPAE